MARFKYRKPDLKSALGLSKPKKQGKKSGSKSTKSNAKKRTSRKAKSFNLLQWFKRKTK